MTLLLLVPYWFISEIHGLDDQKIKNCNHHTKNHILFATQTAVFVMVFIAGKRTLYKLASRDL